MKPKLLGLLMFGCFGTLGAPGVSAQAEEGSARRPAAGALEEVIVTARKRDETVQDVPVAISAFNADFVAANAITSIDDVSDFTPGLVTGKATGETGGNLFMRGIGSGQLSALLEQSVSVNVDGAQAGGQLMFASMLDIDRIEVLKGPQALFYGKNSPGGVISLVTKAPTQDFEGSVKAGYEFDAEEKYGQLILSGPLSDTAQARFLAYRSEADGYLKIKSAVVDDHPFGPAFNSTGYANSTGPRRTEDVFRFGLSLQPTDRLTVDGRITYTTLESDEGFNMNTQMVDCPTGARQAFDPRYAAVEDCKANDTIVTGNMTDAQLAASSYIKHRTGFTDNQIYLGTINIGYELTDELSISSVTSTYGVDLDQSANYSLQPLSLIAASTGLETERYAEELRLLSSYDSPLNFATGFYVESEKATAYTDTNVPIRPVPLTTEITDQDKLAYSIFGQLIWDISDAWTLEAGARYSNEKKEATFHSSDVPGQSGDQEYNAENVSPEATLTYRYTQDIMFYGSYREGFKSGGLDTSAGAPTSRIVNGTPVDYDEETVSGFEGGMKAAFIDGRLRTNFAVFTYEYTDMQLSFLDTTTLSVKVVNAAKAKTSGAEFDFMYSIDQVPGLTLQGAVAYLDAKFDEYIGDCYNGQSIASGCSLDFVAAQGRYTKQSRKDERMQLAPEWTGTLGLMYETPSFAGWYANLSANIEYSDEFQADAEGAPRGWQDSFVRTNASVRLSTDDRLWEISVIGRNLGNEYVVTRTSPDTLAPASSGTAAEVPVDRFGSVSRGREVYLEVTRNF